MSKYKGGTAMASTRTTRERIGALEEHVAQQREQIMDMQKQILHLRELMGEVRHDLFESQEEPPGMTGEASIENLETVLARQRPPSGRY